MRVVHLVVQRPVQAVALLLVVMIVVERARQNVMLLVVVIVKHSIPQLVLIHVRIVVLAYVGEVPANHLVKIHVVEHVPVNVLIPVLLVVRMIVKMTVKELQQVKAV